jgi:hypothetical protein
MKYFINTVLIFLFTVNFVVQAQNNQNKENSLTIQQQLAELNKSFTYKEKLIHPRAIQDLVSFVSDPLPGPIAIDVEGTFNTNRYFGKYEVRENGLIFIDLEQDILEQTGWFAYEHLGRLGNGYHVLRTYDNGGGTGVFGSVLIVEALIDFEYKDDGSRREFLVLKRKGEFGIGDRYSGEIKLMPKENTILISADKPIDGRSYENITKLRKIKIQ